MLDDEVSAVLDNLNATFPPVHEMTGAEARVAVAARRMPVDNPDDVERVDDVEIAAPHGPLRVRLYFPHGAEGAALPVVVFYHGGGFVFCDIESHDGFCREMAKETASIVVSVDYRLAPEHPAPAAAHDAYTALSWALAHARELGGDPARVVVAGDSAGGNLAAVACVMARQAGESGRVTGQVLMYPVLDPSADTESYRLYANGYFNTAAAMHWYWRQYLPDGTLPSPEYEVAPGRAESLEGLPPAVVVTPVCDPLSDEGEAYVGALARAGVPVVHRRYAGLFHGFLTIGPLRAARAARAVLWRDMRELVGSNRILEGVGA